MPPIDESIKGDSENYDTVWRAAPSTIALTQNEVHVWRIPLDRAERPEDQLRAVLSDTEQGRADRFRSADHRIHYLRAHFALRIILANYVGVAPAALHFTIGPRGKPALATSSADDVRFNLSHSGAWALCAVVSGHDVGVDVERIRPDRPLSQLAARYFAPGEVAALRSLDTDVQATAFFSCWTRKEAYIKAIGEGLGIPLDRFEVSVDPAAPAALRWCANDPTQAQRWSLATLVVDPGYAAALAVEGQGRRLRCWQFEG